MEDKTVAIDDISKLLGKQLIVSWPGHGVIVPLNKSTMRLGRSNDGNDIVLACSVVSRYHATLKLDKQGFTIIDGQTRNGQHKPSANGLYFKGRRVKEQRLEPGDVIRIPDRNENFVNIAFVDTQQASHTKIAPVRLNQKTTLGRDPQNDIHLNDPTISRFHAVISRTDDGRHRLADTDSVNDTFVNGQPISEVVLEVDDIIQIGSFQLRYDGAFIIPADLRREGIRLDAIDLKKEVKVKKTEHNPAGVKLIMQDISLVIQPREFVAIVGGSGAGKSTLLDALNGFRPADGEVLVNGDNLYQNFDAYRQSIGYVPQDDIIHRELTVAEALKYAARLRLPPDTPDNEIDERIAAVLEQVAMTDKETVLIKRLSGGQRKRVSIAVELIADPGLIFLDEPTSGLDPGLDKKMMFTLRQVANSGKTVVLITHATGNITECDLVTFLAAGGRLVFFGPPQDALTFFGVDDFAEIYHKVEQETDKWLKAWQNSTYYETYVTKRLKTQEKHKQGTKQARRHSKGLGKAVSTTLRQMNILTRRQFTMLFRDRRNLFFLLLQAPIIALLLYLVIETGLFGQGINTEPLDVANIQKILFVMACVATWFGLINAIREIVKEFPIYKRERLVNLSILSYVSSKMVMLLGLCLFQAFILVMLVHFRAEFAWEGAVLPGPIEIFVTIFLITFTSACFGLFLSAILGREDRVTSVMPLFLVPQIVFAGIVFTLEGGATLISYVTFSRWGVEALGATVNLPELRKMASFSFPMDELPFEFAHTAGYLFQNWGILLGFTVLSIVATIIALRRQDVG